MKLFMFQYSSIYLVALTKAFIISRPETGWPDRVYHVSADHHFRYFDAAVLLSSGSRQIRNFSVCLLLNVSNSDSGSLARGYVSNYGTGDFSVAINSFGNDSHANFSNVGS